MIKKKLNKSRKKRILVGLMSQNVKITYKFLYIKFKKFLKTSSINKPLDFKTNYLETIKSDN